MRLPSWPLLTFLKALVWVIFRRVRKQQSTVSPEERESLKKHVAESINLRWNAETLLRSLSAPESMRGVGIAEAVLELNHECALESARSSEQFLVRLNSMEAELDTLKALRDYDAEDTEACVARMREYHQAHPSSLLGWGFLINTLTRVGHTDEAIGLCRRPPSTGNSLQSLANTYHSHLLLGRLLLVKQDWDGAIQQTKLALACKRDLPGLLVEREVFLPLQILIARARQVSGDESGARYLFRKCLRLTSDQKMQEVIQKSMAEVGL